MAEYVGKGTQDVITAGLGNSFCSFGSSFCINPLEMGDYGKPGRGYYDEASSRNEIEKRVSRVGDDSRY